MPSSISSRFLAYMKTMLEKPNLEYSKGLSELQGGFHTSIYSFRLHGVDDELDRELVLRLFPARYDEVLLESTVQELLAQAGYPVAKPHFVCTDASVLGGTFFVMDYLQGELLMMSEEGRSAEILGKAHSEIHSIDPTPLAEALGSQAISNTTLDSRFDWLQVRTSEMPWLSEVLNWLSINRPIEGSSLVICHGDFHGLNVLVAKGKVTGILDWTSFLFSSPAYDIARTVMIYSIAAKHMPILEADVDWNDWVERYLAEYQKNRLANLESLEYYITLHCIVSLVYGFGGVDFWRQPQIENGLIERIRNVSGIEVSVPD